MKRWNDIIENYDFLKKGLKYVIDNSNSLYLPYHNLNHNLIVLQYCYANLEYEELLYTKESDHLLLSALFHDFNHSGGIYPDNINIREAYEGIKDFIKLYDLNFDLCLFAAYIKTTEYPYINEPRTIYERIIRDSDLCQMFEPNFLYATILGLKQEMGINSMKNIIQMENKFISSLKFHTRFAQLLFVNNISKIKKEIKLIESLYE